MVILPVWKHHFIETNNVRLHYVAQGEGPLVVLLHGFPEFWYSWRHQIPALAKHFRVVVPDLRGYNDSEKPRSGYDINTLTQDVQGLITALGYQHAHVVGHDWGGAIAWNFAQRFPEMLDRLAVLNAPHPQRFVQGLVGNLDQVRRSWYMLAFQVPALPEWLIQNNLSQFVETVFQGLATRKAAFPKETARLYEAALSKPGAVVAALNYYRQMVDPRGWMTAVIPVQSPTLVLWGEEDAVLSRSLVGDMVRFVAAPVRVLMVPNCGHWVQQEAPQTVNRELLNFLRG
ncbi:MAG: alpha/beta hydrolase [Alkalinema sp. RU_4_3]|nr:alpha/beta hydrolase [Alkalinema sp. RU_4_3]